MLTYTTYSEAGGVGKTTISANLAVAHARAGHNVLVIDMDPQDGSLSYLLGVDLGRDSGSADNLVRHMIGRPGSDGLDHLIRETEHGVDVIPSHNMLERLTELLLQAKRLEENADPGSEWPMHEQLLRVLEEGGVPEEYDVLIVDPPATAGPHLYNAIVATRSLVIPLELSGKGERSVEGLDDLVGGLEDELGIEIGVLAAVPNGYSGNKRTHRHYLEEVQASRFDVPVVIRERGAMFEGCWDEQCSAFRFVEEHRDRKRDRELETLEKFDTLAKHLEDAVELGRSA